MSEGVSIAVHQEAKTDSVQSVLEVLLLITVSCKLCEMQIESDVSM